MAALNYSVIIEATKDSSFFGFYSPDLAGFTGTGQSIKDCISKAKDGMEEHLFLLEKLRHSVPTQNAKPNLFNTSQRTR